MRMRILSGMAPALLIVPLSAAAGTAPATGAAPITVAPAATEAAGAAAGAISTAGTRIAAEIARLRQVAAGLPETDEHWKVLRPDIERLLDDAAKEIAAGRLFFGTDRLAEARRLLLALAYRTAGPDPITGMDRFLAAWRDADADLAAGEDQLRRQGWGGTPAAFRALGESASGQTRHLYRASRDYAAADTVASGLLSLGEARAALGFAAFCQGLRMAGAEGATAPPSVAGALAALEARVRAAYVPPRSIDSHTDFIRIHSALKHAGELDEAGLAYGALHAYLRALRAFAVAEAGWESHPVAPRAALGALRGPIITSLSAQGRDHSIGRLFLEQADSALERAVASADPATDLRNAGVLLEQVLPAYLAALQAGPRPQAPRGDLLRVTLVRWPYT